MSPSQSSVGMIGAGAMGAVLIRRLIAADFNVSVFDPSPNARRQASDEGAQCVRDAQAIFAMENPVIICVASEGAFSATIDAAIAAATTRSGNIAVGPIIEASTLPIRVKEVARDRLSAVGIVLLDCPLSGTSAQARDGDLVVFASGDPDSLRLCKPIFATYARRVVQAGDFGMGMRLKLLANHLVGLHSAAAAEVLMLARTSGLSAELALDALIGSAGSSRMLEVRGPLMAAHEYLPATGSINLIVKDGKMIMDMAQQSSCSLPLFSQAYHLYKSAQNDGLGDHDIGAIYDYILKNSTSSKMP